MGHVKRPRIADVATSTWLTGDEVGRLFTVADERGLWEGALVRVLCYTGIRVSELCNARSSDLRKDGTDLTLAVTRKGGERHRVVIPADGESVLREHLGGRTGPLFIGRGGEAVGRDEVAYRLDKLVRAAGIDKRITPHCLRHTAATLAREAGRDIRAVQHLLGHKRIETTMRYEHARLATSDSAAHDIARYVGRGER
jgi:site-specific recombinase XerD